jgi:hypothetical protein
MTPGVIDIIRIISIIINIRKGENEYNLSTFCDIEKLDGEKCDVTFPKGLEGKMEMKDDRPFFKSKKHFVFKDYILPRGKRTPRHPAPPLCPLLVSSFVSSFHSCLGAGNGDIFW